MSEPLEVGKITITYQAEADGDLITEVFVDGDLPVFTQLGLLELAKDTVLNAPEEDE